MKEVRPTSGKVMQALFNMIGPLDGMAFLDLFSGTGRIALEAWKRNARTVVAVELVKSRSSLIKTSTGPSSQRQFTVLSMDVRRAFRWLRKKDLSFDIIFADPPYNAGWPEKILQILADNSEIIVPGGLFFLEHTVKEPVGIIPDGLILSDQRRYGDTLVSIISGF